MTLTLTIKREVEPRELLSLAFGTGALGFSWWHEADIRRGDVRLRYLDMEDDDILETDRVRLVVEDPDLDDEATRVAVLTMQQLLEAAELAIKKGYLHEPDAIKEDLGYADAIEADCVLQLAVFGEEAGIVYG